MIPVMCTVKHNPPNTYGDCVRACVASLLELNSDEVPHFMNNNDANQAHDQMREWLATKNMIPAYFVLSNKFNLEDVGRYMTKKYYNKYFMMFCENDSGDHCVIGRNMTIEHDPAWYKTPIIGAHSDGYWIIIILAEIK